MIDNLMPFLARAAVMVPVIVLFSALMWGLLTKLGKMRPEAPFNAADMRTWPLAFAMGYAALFGVIFAALAAWLGDSQWSSGIAAGGAAFLSLILARFLPPPRKGG